MSYDDYKKVHFYCSNWNDIEYVGHLGVKVRCYYQYKIYPCDLKYLHVIVQLS